MDFPATCDLCQKRVELNRFPLQAASMHSQDHGFETRPANVVAFPAVHRCTAATAAETVHPSTPCSKRPAALSAAEINARLVILLGICVTSAVVVLSAAHLLQGSALS